MRAAVAGQEKPAADAPLETYTATLDDPVFRFSSHNFTTNTSEPIALQIRFPEETTHFTAYYDEKAKQIVFPKQPPAQNPEEFLIAK